MNLTAIRKEFPGVEDGLVYMDTASRALLARPVRAAIESFLDSACIGGDKAAMFRTLESARTRFARLIHAQPHEVAITKNISDGLNMFAAAVDWRAGDNVVVCEALEHANNVYLWRNLRERYGIEVRNLPPEQGRYPVARMCEAIDARTRIVTACTHTFTPGLRTDVEALGSACRAAGAWLLLDGAQTAGIQDIDVAAAPIDALAVSTQKGLLGTYGMGFLYVRNAVAERLKPAALARFGVDLGDANEAAAGEEQWRLRAGAMRFDLGNYNYLGAAAVDASLHLLESVGVPAIGEHTRRLGALLAEGLLELGLPVCGELRDAARDHIVSVGHAGAGHDSSSDTQMQSLYDFLLKERVKLSIRKDMLRFSLHLYNTEDEVRQVVALARRWRTAARSPA